MTVRATSARCTAFLRPLALSAFALSLTHAQTTRPARHMEPSQNTALSQRVAPAQEMGPVGSDAVEGEWTLRSWALAPEEHRENIRAALADSDWRRRWAALEALRRAARIGAGAGLWAELESSVLALCSDAHPNVRARAAVSAAAYARFGQGALALEEGAGGAGLHGQERLPQLEPAVLLELARDSLPEVRAACAELGTVRPFPAVIELLQGLCFDADRTVAERARAELINLEAGLFTESELAVARAALFLQVAAQEGSVGLLRLVELLERAPFSRELRAELRAGLAAMPASDSVRALASLVEALSFLRFGEGQSETLIQGWLVGLASGAEGSWEDLAPARRDLARAAVAAAAARDDAAGKAGDGAVDQTRDSPGGATSGALFEAFFAALEAADAARDGRRVAGYLEGVLEAADAQSLADRALDSSLSEELQVELWSRLVGRGARWDAERTRPWLNSSRTDDLRLSVGEALGDSLRRNADPGAGALLVELAGAADARLARRAFRALCSAPEPTAWQVELHTAWRGLDDERRLRSLELISRASAPLPFRGDLLLLGHGGRAARTPSLVELLALFEGDAEVAQHLSRWLESAVLELVQRSSSQFEDDPARRALELHTRGLTRALQRVHGSAAAPVLTHALERLCADNVEAGKTLAWALGQTPGGRAELAVFLEPPVLRRIRIEAALWLAREARALELLLASYRGCDGELRGRILRRLARLEDRASLDFLASAASSSELEVEERVAALEALAERAGSGSQTELALQAVERCAAHAPDVETLLAALGVLGSVGGEAAGAVLLAYLEELAARELPPGGASERWIVLRDELLPALARAGQFPPELERELWRMPLTWARSDLEARFQLERLTATDFRYRAEIAVAESLAAAGRLDEWLSAASAAPWWRADARLLILMGERASKAGEAGAVAAVLLLRAGLVALAGEPELEGLAGLEVLARARLFELAQRAGRQAEARAFCVQLLAEWRRGQVGRREWARAFGNPDPRAGVDPQARLESALSQTRAWMAFAAGRETEARRWAQSAQARLGASRAAAREQERLLRAIGSAR